MSIIRAHRLARTWVAVVALTAAFLPSLALANATPTIQLPAPLATTEDLAVAIPGIVIGDLDDDYLVVFIASPAGTLGRARA